MFHSLNRWTHIYLTVWHINSWDTLSSKYQWAIIATYSWTHINRCLDWLESHETQLCQVLLQLEPMPLSKTDCCAQLNLANCDIHKTKTAPIIASKGPCLDLKPWYRMSFWPLFLLNVPSLPIGLAPLLILIWAVVEPHPCEKTCWGSSFHLLGWKPNHNCNRKPETSTDQFLVG